MDDIDKIIKAWDWFAGLPSQWRFGIAGGAIVIGISWALDKLRGHEGRDHMERVIQENANLLREDVSKLSQNLNDFKVETAGHFGRLDARMESFEGNLEAHDQRGIALRKDVKEALNSRTRMV